MGPTDNESDSELQVPAVASTSAPPNVNITLYNIHTSFHKVRTLTDEELTEFERLFQIWFVDYFQKEEGEGPNGEQRRRHWKERGLLLRQRRDLQQQQPQQPERLVQNMGTTITVQNQSVTSDIKGLYTNTITYHQQLWYVDPWLLAGEHEANNQNDAAFAGADMGLKPQDLAIFPFLDFSAKTDLALVFRNNIFSMGKVQIPLQVPIVDGGNGEVTAERGRAERGRR